MKKIIVVFMLFFNVCILSSCKLSSCFDFYVEGFENITHSLSSTSLDIGFINYYNTFKKYSYIDGNYFYYDNLFGSEKFLIYFKYEEEDYWKAKEHLFENFSLWEEPIKEYNDYIFYLNIDYVDYAALAETNENYDYWYHGFPVEFQTYCYNDRTFTLMLVGYSAASNNREEYGLAKDEFGKFLESAFGEYYDFNQ